LLYEATLAMSKRLNAAAARIRDSKEEVYGDLRVTTTAGFGSLWLAPRLHKLFEAHPDLSVNLILTEAILDLPMREADVAIRMASPQQADLIRRPLMDVTMRLYASQDYIEKAGLPLNVDELAQRRVISFSPNAPQPNIAADWLKQHIHPQRRTHLMINSYFGVMKAAINGLGVAALPDYITRDYPELVNILPEEASPPFSVYFVYPEELRRSRRVIAFRDFMVSEVEIFKRQGEVRPRVASSA
jgi:DNA-binding transcriptional LysR family regulator